MSTPYIAANTEGLSVSPAVIARGSVAGDSRSTGVPGRHVVRLRAQQRRSTRGEARFRLRDVGARHLADIKRSQEPIGYLKPLFEKPKPHIWALGAESWPALLCHRYLPKAEPRSIRCGFWDLMAI